MNHLVFLKSDKTKLSVGAVDLLGPLCPAMPVDCKTSASSESVFDTSCVRVRSSLTKVKAKNDGDEYAKVYGSINTRTRVHTGENDRSRQ